MTLRERCKKLYQKLGTDAMLRQHDPVQTIVEFVVAETGRAAGQLGDNTLPLVLYFKTEEDREEFIELFKITHPTMISRKV